MVVSRAGGRVLLVRAGAVGRIRGRGKSVSEWYKIGNWCKFRGVFSRVGFYLVGKLANSTLCFSLAKAKSGGDDGAIVSLLLLTYLLHNYMLAIFTIGGRYF